LRREGFEQRRNAADAGFVEVGDGIRLVILDGGKLAIGETVSDKQDRLGERGLAKRERRENRGRRTVSRDVLLFRLVDYETRRG
jgi:hypothetical protein